MRLANIELYSYVTRNFKTFVQHQLQTFERRGQQ